MSYYTQCMLFIMTLMFWVIFLYICPSREFEFIIVCVLITHSICIFIHVDYSPEDWHDDDVIVYQDSNDQNHEADRLGNTKVKFVDDSIREAFRKKCNM